MRAEDLQQDLLLSLLFLLVFFTAFLLLRPKVPASGSLVERRNPLRNRDPILERLSKDMDDFDLRLRAVEQQVGRDRALLDSIHGGQTRNERMLEMLVSHHLQGERT